MLIIEKMFMVIDVELYANEAIEMIDNWLKMNGLLLGEQKIEVVFI